MKNVVLITIDECKASALSGYGNEYTITPASELMKSEGVQIKNAFTCHTKCVPARASLLSGRYSHCEGHRTLPGFELREEEWNLASFLRDKGYSTAMFGKNHTVEPDILNKVFDKTSKKPLAGNKKRVLPDDMPMDDPMWRAFYRGSWNDWRSSMPADTQYIDESIDFLKEHREDCFFLLCNLEFPHPPYYEMEGFIGEIRKTSPSLPPKEKLESAPNTLKWYRKAYNCEMLSEKDWQTVQNAYFSMVSFIDTQTMRILRALEELSLTDDTLIIYTSDHGDFAGEHGCAEKYDTLFYDCIVKIPLYFMAPDIHRRTINGLVENIDIAPTVLEALGYDIPKQIHGRSLWQALCGEQKIDKKYVFCEGGVEDSAIENAPHYDSEACIRMKPHYYWKQIAAYNYKKSMQRSKMIRDHNYKLVYRQDGTKEFYDLVNDPYEINDVSDDPRFADIILKMMGELLKWCIRTETDYPPIENLFA